VIKPQIFYEAKWTDALKDEYYQTHPENFAGPHKTYPIKDASDVGDAWGLAGQAADADAVRAKIKAIAKRMGLSSGLPDTAKDAEKQESAATIPNTAWPPLEKIATLKVCWLKYNARSVNGRIYPKATCDRIYESALRKLAANDLSVTCFVSHEDANNNVNTKLVGHVSKIWQEGAKFWADIDMADTGTSRDVVALYVNGALRSESMRVLGVELIHDRNYDLPLVVIPEGVEPELLGIDFTTRPGLNDTARIQQVLYESAQAAPYTESFSLDSVSIQSKEEAPMSIPLYLQVIAEAMTDDRKAHQSIHDNLAGVLDATVKAQHGSESARLMALVESELTEEGRAIAVKHAVKIANAHDAAAHQLGMKCEGCYKEALGIPLDPDQDNDGLPDNQDPSDDGESAKKGQKTMTEAEMLAALKAKGYSVAAPKTVGEQLAELRALSETQAAQLAALKESAPPTQRQTQAPSALNETSALTEEQFYEDGDYLKGTLAPTNWKALANRRVPWPKDIDPALALHELAPFLAYRLLDQEAVALGRDIGMLIGPNDQI
jgi:hypothetical protein